ncbi:MAG: hypothetical protein JWM10_700 [Myxococcaceae bacterium]|nr:hypothetical protein [Myxococcaceae bacterium]
MPELVTERLNGFTLADSMDLAKVERAFREAPASMLRGAEISPVDFAPVSGSGVAGLANGLPVDHQVYVTNGYGDNGVAIFASRSENAVVQAFGARSRIVPGLLWAAEPDQGSFLIVTPDGARFWAERRKVYPYSAVTDWPPPNQVEGLTDSDVMALVEIGQLPATFRQQIEVARTRFTRCATPMWAAWERRAEAIDLQNIFERVRRARIQEARDRTVEQVDRQCSTRPFQEVLAAAVEARRPARARLYEAVVALRGPHR